MFIHHVRTILLLLQALAGDPLPMTLASMMFIMYKFPHEHLDSPMGSLRVLNLRTEIDYLICWVPVAVYSPCILCTPDHE